MLALGRDAGSLDGDLLVVDRSDKPGNGCVVVVAVNGEYTVKCLRRCPDCVWLEPASRLGEVGVCWPAAMADEQEAQTGTTIKLSRWQQYLVASLLILAGVIHAIAPHRLQLDWPTIAVVFVGLLLMFLPLQKLSIVVKTLKIGGTELLLKDSENLGAKVQNAETEEMQKALPEIHASAYVAEEDRLQVLLSGDKEMALIRIGIELERLLAKLYGQTGGKIPATGLVWKRAVDHLQKNGTIGSQTAEACLGFRNLRNRLIHPSAEEAVLESVVGSTVDTGLKLVRLLSALDAGPLP